eukprot:315533-Pyramimonas_sp.AAC.1
MPGRRALVLSTSLSTEWLAASMRVRRAGVEQRMQAEELQKMHAMLPREILNRLALFGHGCLGWRIWVRSRLAGAPTRSFLCDSDAAPCGIWQDGVPCNWGRSVAADIASFPLPGLEERRENLRVPIACLLQNQWPPHALNAIFEIARWSFARLAARTRPSRGSDSLPFRKSDKGMVEKHSERGRLVLRGVLCQIKGDWEIFKEALRLPGWRGAGRCSRREIKLPEVTGKRMLPRPVPRPPPPAPAPQRDFDAK